MRQLLFAIFFSAILISYGQKASFNVPDTVCVGQTINIQNTSTGQSSNLWDFCKQAPANTISGVNLGDVGMAPRPSYIQILKEGANYIGFVSNETPGGAGIRRLNFGSNLLNNSPVVDELSTFSGNLDGPKGAKYLFENGKWYAFVVADNWTSGHEHQLIRLDFGTSLLNDPTITDFGNLGGVIDEYLTELDVVKDVSNNFIGFISTASGNLFRLNFGTNILNTPTVSNLGKYGYSYPTYSFNLFQRNGYWYLFMPKDDPYTGNSTLLMLKFGNSLLNNPSLVNFGNPNNLLNRAYDFLPFVDCEGFKGFVLSPGSNSIIEYTFLNDVESSSISGVNKGNIAGFNFPSDFSNVITYNNEEYVFITNQSSNTLSRLKLSTNCNSFGVPSSNLLNPPPFQINTTGTYNISLTIDKNLPAETKTCREITVINAIQKPDAQINTITCTTDSIRLSIANIATGVA